MVNFVTAERDQMILLPPSIREWLPEKHLAVFVADVVDRLDLSALQQEYRGAGKQPFAPSLLVSLLFYGYATGVFSSRRIETATYDSVAFRYLSGDTHPDHDTIATFRRRFIEELEALFAQIVLIAREMGFAKVGTVSIDGTKIKANASKHKAMSWEYACKLEKKLRREVAALLRKAEQADKHEDNEAVDIPEELRIRQTRLARIEQAKEALKERARQRQEHARQQQEARRRKQEGAQQRHARKMARKASKAAQQSTPEPKDQHNFTDGESRIMKSHGAFEQCYNAQAAVDVEDMLIVGATLTNNAADAGSLLPTLDAVEKTTGEKPGAVIADAGYFSEDNMTGSEQRDIDAYIATGRERHNVPLAHRLRGESPKPKFSSPLRRIMWEKLRTEIGRELYRVRKCISEPVYGIMKNVMGFRRFMLRGKRKVRGEWFLACSAYDIRRLHALNMA
jgi:transposase